MLRSTLVLGLCLVLWTACGSSQPKCFECGLTDEWRAAEREEQEAAARRDAGAPGEPVVSPDAAPPAPPPP